MRSLKADLLPAIRVIVGANSLALITVGLLLLAGTPAFAADCVTTLDGAKRALVLRATPTVSSQSKGSLAVGQVLPLTASVPNWVEVQLPDGGAAFASKRGTQIVVCPPGVAAVAPGAAGQPAGASDGRPPAFELHAIDVGTGLAILVRGPDFDLLYDAGSNDDLALGEDNRALSYLKSLQPAITKIDHVLLSHPHRDHVELLPDVLKAFPPGDVWNSGAFNGICGYRMFLTAIGNSSTTKYHTATMDAVEETISLPAQKCYGQNLPAAELKLQHAARITNDQIPLGQSGNASMTILHADGSKRSSYNENSLVVRLDLGGTRVLIMGDAEAGGRKSPTLTPADESIEGKLLACCSADLKADVLVVGHHGSKTSSRVKTLDAIGAKLFIVSAGPTKYATVVLPDQDVIEQLEKRGKVFRTDIEDDQCANAEVKFGPAADGKAGGCDNVLLRIPVSGAVAAAYKRPGQTQ